MKRPPPRGFTRLELSLLIAAVVLVATLWTTLVVLQKAREAARRAACSTNLKQF